MDNKNKLYDTPHSPHPTPPHPRTHIMINPQIGCDTSESGDSTVSITVASWKDELKYVGSIGGKVALMMFGRMLLMLTDIGMLGHISTEALSGASTGLIWINVTSFFIYRALCPSLKTLASAALGAKNPHQAGQWLQLTLYIACFCWLGISCLWLAAGPVFKHVFGIDHDEADKAYTFILYSLIWLPVQLLFGILNNFFQALEIVTPSLIATLSAIPLNALLNLFFIWGIPNTSFHGLGFIGSPIATATTRWFILISYGTYMLKYKKYHKKAWGGWSSKSLQQPRKKTLYKLFFPLAIGSLFEEAQLQTVSMFAVKMGSNDIAAHTTMMNIFMCLTAVMMGVRSAVNVRVSHHLGRRDAASTVVVAKVGFGVAVSIGFIISAILVFVRNEVGKLFTGNEEVIHLISQIITIMCAGYFMIGLFAVCTTLMTAAHKTGLVAITFLVGAWGVSVPLSYMLGFYWGHGVVGLWEGLIGGYTVIIIVGMIFLFRIDWEKTADMVHKKALENSEKITTLNDGDSCSDDDDVKDENAPLV